MLKNKNLLFCSGCEVYHSKIFFSAKQSTVLLNKRICIGLEGGIRLCSHKTVRWDDLRRGGYLTKRHDKPFSYWVQSVISCFHPSHRRRDMSTAVSYPGKIDPN